MRMQRLHDFESLKKTLFEHFEKHTGIPFQENESDIFHDPHALHDMEKAVERILKALEQKEKILIYGDFDTDGITSTVLLVQALRDLGAEVSYRIPDRTRHSHGLKEEILEPLAEKGVKLIITADCGINDQKLVEYAVSKGLEVIITDHHDPDPHRFPHQAVAVINPLLEGSLYPEKYLSGSAVALKLVEALFKKVFPKEEALQRLKRSEEMASLGLIADCVPLQGESRSMVRRGLRHLQNTDWESLEYFFETQNLSPKERGEEMVSFTLAPRLNAASRLGNVLHATELFLGDCEKMPERWQYLESLNQERKSISKQCLVQARSQIDPHSAIQVLYRPEWLQGILGLIAGKISEELQQVVLALREIDENFVAGSGRASEGFNLIAGLRAYGELFEHFGGHEGAAGFVARKENIPQIKSQLNQYFIQNKKEVIPQGILGILNPKLITDNFLDLLESLSPFGVGHPIPLFQFPESRLLQKSPLGSSGEHGKIVLKIEDSVLEMVAFFLWDELKDLPEKSLINPIFSVKPHYFRGQRSAQIRLERLESRGLYSSSTTASAPSPTASAGKSETTGIDPSRKAL